MSSQNAQSPPRLEAKLLYRRLDALFGTLDPNRPQRELLEAFFDEAFQALRDDLRLRGALLYAERRDGFTLIKRAGDIGGSASEELDPASAPMQLLFRHRVYIFPDAAAEGSPYRSGYLPPLPTAAVLVGRRPRRHAFFFVLGDGWMREELDFALNTVRAALGSRLADERVRGSFREAAEIQQSLLVEEAPDFPGFELACRSQPAEEVGGDFYDFLLFDDETLGLAIGDASGHGLPAALQVRDVVTGLRMGIEKNLKIAYAFEKLNRVIHRSNLSSRFVSVFYGELEKDGTLVYVNGGHQPPLVFRKDAVSALAVGGTVIGPLPEARFRRGIARLERGETMVLCTDGIVERRNPAGDFLGEDGLIRLVRANETRSAEEILDAVFEATQQWGDGRTWDDDATAVIVKRL
jgi:sigma-B regulation protein RsbU (phosphoserine phosphatase)